MDEDEMDAMFNPDPIELRAVRWSMECGCRLDRVPWEHHPTFALAEVCEDHVGAEGGVMLLAHRESGWRILNGVNGSGS